MNHFVCIVAGENPDNLIKQYDNNYNIEKTIVYSFKDADFIKQSYIKMYEALLNRENLNEYEKLIIETDLDGIKEDSNIEFFSMLTQEYEHDQDTGDAITYKNVNGKYETCKKGNNFSVPFILNDGGTSFQARKNEINWEQVHMPSKQIEIYDTVWELIINKKIPQNDTEKLYYKNMKDNIPYLMSFKTKENYISAMCSFWGYAFPSEKTGWKELEPNMNQYEWVKEFFNTFIKPLTENTKLTIYECTK